MNIVVETIQTFTKTHPSFTDDRAVAEFRGFLETGKCYIERTEHPAALNVMQAVINELNTRLQMKKERA